MKHRPCTAHVGRDTQSRVYLLCLLLFVCVSTLVGCGKTQEEIAADLATRTKLEKEKAAAARQAALELRAVPYVEVLKDHLRDPASAQIRLWRFGYIYEIGYALCGEVNAKNGFGGYAGFQPFAVFDSALPGHGRVVIGKDSYALLRIEEAKCFEKTGLN